MFVIFIISISLIGCGIGLSFAAFSTFDTYSENDFAKNKQTLEIAMSDDLVVFDIINADNDKKLIKIHDNWEFIYIGADIDSYAEGSSLGIKTSNIANYEKSRKGINKMFGAVSKLSEMYQEESCIDESWKKELE